ncbi:hypothetical protein D3C76_766950 [compost metagenome]
MPYQVFQQSLVEHFFAGQRPALGRQCLVFECLEFGSDEALSALEGLPANIVSRRLFGLFARQFDEITVDAVVTDLEVGQARAGFFPRFQVDQELPGVFAE